MERRRNARLDISLECRLSSPRLGAASLAGVTENMSRGDMLVRIGETDKDAALPVPGDPVIVEIDLPANHAFGRKCMQCQTTVVRVSGYEGGFRRIAMRIHKIRFQSCEAADAMNHAGAQAWRQVLM